MRRRLWRIIHDPAGYTGLPLAFKGLLILGLAVIAALLIYSTTKLVTKLKESERRLAQAYAAQWKRAAETTDPQEIGYLFEQIIIKSDFPIIVAEPDGDPLYWRGLPGIADHDTIGATRERIRAMMVDMSREYPPVPITYGDHRLYNLHYGDFRLLSNVQRLPYIGIAVMALFILIAYVSFRNIKRAEQRYIWVGMARETAHQLGTPLSSLMGWLEHISEQRDAAPQNVEIINHMRADVARLRLVANRFGMIGSVQDKSVLPVAPIVRETTAYFRARLPHSGTGVALLEDYQPAPSVPINADLIAWVLENLIKNSLDVVDSRTGRIMVAVRPHAKDGVIISVEDNGPGIPARDQSKIFHAGFTTKKRGWGLGLTLARRIVMEYHDGDLYLETSVPQKATRFALHLPAS